MSGRRGARWALAIVIVIALGVLVPPTINLSHYRNGIADSISRALDRKTTVGGAHLQLLPQPGIVLQNFVVSDDPRFGVEPLLRSDEVTATLRLSSLWRGRLEIGSLSLKDPSLNLVRAADGHWNIESLLQRASQTPSAPTGKKRPESRPRFPYIEAQTGRINLKIGEEKKVWALTEADFALWQSFEDEWRARLAARPVRTDATLSDTGRLRVTGSFQRRNAAEQALVSLHVSLEGAQLGQLTTLVYGRDRGWRGGTSATLDVTGTPARLIVASAIDIDQFRRYDITPPDTLRLQVRCAAEYMTAERRVSSIECHLPTGGGELSLHGTASSFLDHPQYNLNIAGRDVPMSYGIALARRAKRDLPNDLTATGLLNAAVTLRRTGEETEWDGGGNASGLSFSSSTMGAPLALEKISFVVEPDTPDSPNPRVSAAQPAPDAWRIAVRPFNLPLGAAPAATAQASLGANGYSIQIAGPASLDRLLHVARAAGLPAPAGSARGAARGNIQIAGIWQGFPQPLLSGSADLHNVRFELAGIGGPVQIASAALLLTPSQAIVQNLVAGVGDGALSLSGTIRIPRACVTPVPCRSEFALKSDYVSLDGLNRLLNPRVSEHWYSKLTRGAEPLPSLFSRLHATGIFQIGRLAVKGVALQNVAGTLRLDPGVVELSNGSAALYGGLVRGNWRADFSGADPAYSGSGSLERVALAQISTAMHDNWATGTANADYRIVASGWSAQQLLDSSAGSLDFTWRDGQLRHLSLADAMLRIRSFRGHATIRNGILTIADSSMETPAGIYNVTGTASRARELDLVFAMKGNQQYSVMGTLDAPHVQARVVSEPRASISR